MNGISLIFGGCGETDVCFPNYPTAPRKTKGVYIALGLFNKGALATLNVTNAKISNGTTDDEAVILAARKLHKLGKGIFIPAPNLSGSKPKATEMVDGDVYGLRVDSKPTGDVTSMFSFKYEYFYTTQSVRWFNKLRENSQAYDALVFSDNAFYVIEGRDIDFVNIGTESTGSATENMKGSFDMRFLGYGDPVPHSHDALSLLQGYTKLTITAGTATVVTKAVCAGKCDRFTFTTSPVTGTIPLTVTDIDVPCITWELKPCAGGALPAGISITQAGVVTFTAYATLPLTKYIAIAYTDGCVFGEYCFDTLKV